MKKTTLFLMLLAFVATLGAQAAEEAKAPIQPKEKIELFNGKDLSNWNTFLKDPAADPAKTFSVEGGVLKCTGEPWGYLRSKEVYANYVLTVEWRYDAAKITPKSNTGFFVHCTGPDKQWPMALECQGAHGGQGNFVAFKDIKFDGMSTKGLNNPRKGDDPEKPAGEWNVYKIVCDGTTVSFYVNDKLMNEAKNLNASSGNICLQSEGGVWELRKATLEPLEKQDATKKGGKKGGKKNRKKKAE